MTLTPVQQKVAAFILVIFLLLGGTVFCINAWVTQSCETRAEARQNTKGAFEDLIDVLDPERQSPRTIEYEKRLNERIKPLQC